MKITCDVLEDELLRKLDDLVDIQKIERAVSRAALLVEAEAKKKAPRDNGDLARSITSKVETSGNEVTGTVFTPLFYAPYVEYGTGLFAEDGDGRKDVPWHYKDDKGDWHSTSGQKPQPFLRPALDENREQVLRIIMEGLIDD